MGTERELREGLKQQGEFECEVGEFVNSSQETVTFIRVTDYKTLCTESLSKMRESGQVPKGTVGISLLVCGDKRGSSTKILCQFTNSQAPIL